MVRVREKGFLRLFGVAVLATVLQGCAPQGFEAGNSEKSSMSDGDYRVSQSKVECQFVGPDVLRNRIINVLEIPVGDVPVLSALGQPTATMRLASSLEALGKGDVSRGKLDDFSCSTTKYKVSTEIMVDACVRAMPNPTVRAKLFPSGLSSFDSLYQALVGRLPTDFESQVLSELVGQVSGSRAEAAACGAVAVSLESLIKI
jgi:hypothetical protein